MSYILKGTYPALEHTPGHVDGDDDVAGVRGHHAPVQRDNSRGQPCSVQSQWWRFKETGV